MSNDEWKIGLLFQCWRLLLAYSFQLNKSTEPGYHHAFDNFGAARQGWSIAIFRLAVHVIPNLTVGTFTIPAEVTVRDRVQRKILKAAQQPVLFRNLNLLTDNFDRDQSLVRIEQITVDLFSLYVLRLFVHAADNSAMSTAEYSRSDEN
jgi:hypothetical protein